MKSVAVIGAGIGGLAVSLRLKAQGFRVVVFEKNHRPGGKLAELHMDGFRFDTGPSLFTLPEYVEELFELFGEKMSDFIPYRQLDVNCRYFFPDDSQIVFYHDQDRLRDELSRSNVQSAHQLFARLQRAARMYELGAPVFLNNDLHRLAGFNTPSGRRAAMRLAELDFMRSMHGANMRDFCDRRLVSIFDRYATYNGSDPYKAPATLNMIAHLENNLGASFPLRGMYSIADGLFRLARRYGVEFRLGTRVESVVRSKRKVEGICSANGFEHYDIVVCDADVAYAADNLLSDGRLVRRLAKRPKSSSALIFYWGMNGIHSHFDLHNIFFSDDYRAEFRDIFTRHTIPDEPTVYLFISSRMVPDDAPSGCENWFAMINVPADCGQHWDELIPAARRRILRRIEHFAGHELESHIICEHVASPLTIERDTFSHRGALYGTASNSMFSAFLRHPNYSSRCRNLYFTGGSVHPGGGIPLCVASAKIVAQLISRSDE